MDFDDKIPKLNKQLAREVSRILDNASLQYEQTLEHGDVFFSLKKAKCNLTIDIRYDLTEIFLNDQNKVFIANDDEYFSLVCDFISDCITCK